MRIAARLALLFSLFALPLMAEIPGAWPEVNLANANVVLDRTEIRLYWAGPVMEVRRIYNARSHANGPLGYGWRLAYSRQLDHKPGENDITITEDDGAVSHYRRKGSPRFDRQPCCSGQFVEILSDGQYTRIRDGLLEKFDGRGRLIRIGDSSDLTITLTYGSFGLTEIRDSANRSFKLAWSPDGRVASISEAFEGFPPEAARSPRTVSFRQDAQGDLISVTDATRAETRYTYDKAHRLLTVTQATLERAALTYDAKSDWVTGLTLPGGRKLTYAWTVNKKDHTAKVTDEAGLVTTHAYAGDTLTITDPEGLVTRQTQCTACGGYFESQNAAGGTLTHRHEDHAFVSQDANGGVARVERDPVKQVVLKQVDRTGAATTFGHDARGNLLSITDPDKNVTLAERDDRGFVRAVIRADQVRVELSAGPLGLPTAIKEPTASTTIAYDAAGLPRQIADSQGRTVTLTYDAADRPLSIADTGGMQRDLRYDDMGRVISEVSGADHHRTTFVYGAPDSGPGEGRLTRAAFGTSAETRFGYDSRGNVTQVSRDGNAYSMKYDRADRPVAVTDPVSATVRLDYDALGNVTRVTDPLGNRTDSKYDAGGRLTERTDPAGRAWSFAYDGEGRVRNLKLPGGREVTAVYDASGRLLSIKPPAGGAEAYAYSPLGRVNALTDAVGQKIQLTYDAGRVTAADDPVLGKVRYGYTADGRLSEVLAENGRKITITYDDQARSRKIVTSTDQRIETKLDWEDRRLEESGPGYHLRWSYYEDGFLKDVTDLATQRAHRYRYDGLGHRTVWSDPDGKDTIYRYDAGGRLAKIEDRLGLTLKFTYDAAGRRVKRELDSGLTTLYGYDPSGRLVDLSHLARDKPVARTQLAYGPSGVVRELTQDDRKSTVSVDASDRVMGAAPTATPTRDAGTVKSEVRGGAKPVSYQYDAFTRLVAANLSTGGDVKLGYGPDLRWTGYAGPLGRSELVYETDNLVAEKDAAGALVAEYALGPGVDEVVAMKRDGRLFNLVTDHLGSVIKVLDPNGTVVREVTYSLAGEMTETGTVPCAFGFTGRPYEPHTGLVNLRLRWLNPRLAAFQTLDPLIPASRFEYAHGNPVTFVDPLGAAVGSWLTGDAFAQSANLASTGAGPVLLGSAGAAALTAFAAGPRSGSDARALARTLVRTAAGRAIGRSLVDDSPLALPRARPPSLTSGAVAEILERAAPLPDRATADRALVSASSRALSRGLFPSAARHVAHRLLDAVWATGPLDAPPLSAAELVQQAIAESLTMRVTPVTPPRSPCERLH